jgi:nucleoside-triphosphatase THEP1
MAGRDAHPTRLVIVLIALVLTLTGSRLAVPVGFVVVLTTGLAGDRSTFRRLGKPRFWVFSLVVVLLAGLLLGRDLRPVLGVPVSLEGLQAGLIMNLRAFTLVLGFVLVSRNLTRDRFLLLTGRIGLPHYIPAFNQALQTMPQMKDAWNASNAKGRVFGFDTLVDFLVLAKHLAQNPVSEGMKIFAVTGRRSSGKTTLLKELYMQAVEAEIKAGGFIQERFSVKEDDITGYKVISLTTSEALVIAERKADEPYHFNDDAFKMAAFWLERDTASCNLLLVDEMGMLEAKGKGHSPVVLKAMEKYPGRSWVMALRKDKLRDLLELFNIDTGSVIDLDDPEPDVEKFVSNVLEKLKDNNSKMPL